MDQKDRKYTFLAIRIVGDFGATIAVPVVVFVIIGQWLDTRYEAGPVYTILGFVLAALVSGKSIYRKAKVYGRDYLMIEPKTPDKTKTLKEIAADKQDKI